MRRWSPTAFRRAPSQRRPARTPTAPARPVRVAGGRRHPHPSKPIRAAEAGSESSCASSRTATASRSRGLRGLGKTPTTRRVTSAIFSVLRSADWRSSPHAWPVSRRPGRIQRPRSRLPDRKFGAPSNQRQIRGHRCIVVRMGLAIELGCTDKSIARALKSGANLLGRVTISSSLAQSDQDRELQEKRGNPTFRRDVSSTISRLRAARLERHPA